MDTQKNTVIDGSVKLPIFNIRYLLHKHSVETKLFNNYEFILPEFDEMKEYYKYFVTLMKGTYSDELVKMSSWHRSNDNLSESLLIGLVQNNDKMGMVSFDRRIIHQSKSNYEYIINLDTVFLRKKYQKFGYANDFKFIINTIVSKDLSYFKKHKLLITPTLTADIDTTDGLDFFEHLFDIIRDALTLSKVNFINYDSIYS